MISKRIIPCLDIRGGRVVKGVNFKNVKDVSEPVSLAGAYSREGADELVFYDIRASLEDRGPFTDILRRLASEIFIPLTVGGGINSIEDFDRVLKSGADKVSVNSAAIKRIGLIDEAAFKYGSQCVVLSVDVKRVCGDYHLFTAGGGIDTGIPALKFIEEGVKRGAGEVVVNSIDTDGVRGGFDIDLLREVVSLVDVPVVASGGAGSIEDFKRLFKEVPDISAGLAASIFHSGEVGLGRLKEELAKEGILVRV